MLTLNAPCSLVQVFYGAQLPVQYSELRIIVTTDVCV